MSWTLTANLNKLKNCRLVKCIYVKESLGSNEEQYGFNQVYKFIKHYLEMFQSFKSSVNKKQDTDDLLQDFEREFLKFAATVKHPGFKEENEWRLILALDETNPNEKVLYRAGKSMLTPFIEINIRDENECLNIPDIWVGPTPHPHLSQISIVDFLNAQKVYAYKYQEAITNPAASFWDGEGKDPMEKVAPTVQISEIPYRDW